MNFASNVNYTWRPLDAAIEGRIKNVLDSWLDTPYMDGQRQRKVGVDCAQLVGGVLDDLFRSKDKVVIPRLRTDSGIHSIRAGFATVRAIRKHYKSKVVRDGTLEPGDVIVTRATGNTNGPKRLGHAMLVSTRKGVLIHATTITGVCLTSLKSNEEIVRVYRPLNKELWR